MYFVDVLREVTLMNSYLILLIKLMLVMSLGLDCEIFLVFDLILIFSSLDFKV